MHTSQRHPCRHVSVVVNRFLVGLVSAVMLSACCDKPAACPAPTGQKCSIGAPTEPGLPRLFRTLAVPPKSARYAAKPICKLPHSVSDECELVDDVQTILGTGFNCQNGSDVALGPCEGWTGAQPLRAASDTAQPCGPSACANVTFDVRDPDGKALRITFYDDISCHRPPLEPNCQRSGRACYYRVLRVDAI
jgi:hypothetical protein